MIGQWEQAEQGVKRKVFPPGERLMMMEVHFDKDAIGAEHSHPHEQFTYCLKGSFQFTISGQTQIVRAGETLVIPSDAKHSAVALEDGILLDTFTPLREDLIQG